MAKRTTHSKEKKAKNQKKASKPFNTPHNDFFGQLMNRKEIAIAFFNRFLPPYILSQADFSTLRIEESKHIMLGGVKLYNDIIYSLTLVPRTKGMHPAHV